ncbi:hypothetical protein ACH3VR_14660 [Microbacterium sp. B2969]|uniref:FtsX-like permease family protein n=1 Tax=Microbacterium alkaliflavum TaxID=3248839 RepID=A0ABW7Q9Q0_9MICO
MRVRSARLALASLVTAPVVSAFVVAFIALTAFAGAAAPALLHAAQTATVRSALDTVPLLTRDLSGATRGVPRPGPGASPAAAALDDARRASWGAALDAVAQTVAGFRAPLRDVLGTPSVVVVSDPVASVPAQPKRLNRVTVTFDPSYGDRIEVVEGRLPESHDEGGVVEVVLSHEAAETLDWPIGEVRDIAFSADAAARLELVGLYKATDDADPYWTHVPTGARPAAVTGPLGDVTEYATVYAAPEAIGVALDQPDWFATQAWLPLDLERVDGATAGELAQQLRASSGVQVPIEVVLESRYPLGLSLGSSAARAIEDAIGRVDAMTGTIAFVVVGPFVVAVVVLALAARLVATRRVRTVRLAAARGASSGLLGGLLAAEGLLLGVVGAAVGVTAAAVLVGFEGAASLLIPVVVALTPVAALPWISLSLARRHARQDLGVVPRGAALRRAAIEIAILVVAALLTVVAVTGGTGVDPALLVLPLALSAAACVLALRLLPLLLAAVESRASRTRGLVPLVGPARGRRDASVRAAPVLAVVLGVAVVLFSVAFWATETEGVATAARVKAGADLRLEAPYLSDAQLDQLRDLGGIAQAAELSEGSRVELEAGAETIRATVYITDVHDLAAVQGASGFTAIPTPEGLAAGGDAIPAVASPALTAALGGGGATLEGRPVDIVATAPAVARPGPAETWLLVDDSVTDRLGAVSEGPGAVLFALDPRADPEAVSAAVLAVAGPGARVSTPQTNAAALEADPALRTVYLTLAASALGVAILLALAIGMTLVLGAPGRARLMALLAALGYPRRRDVPLVLWEVGPALLVALPFGVAVGFALAQFALPQLGTSAFLGGALEPAVRMGGWMPVAVVAGFTVFCALAVFLAAGAASRMTASSAVRSGDEEG